MKSTRSLLLSIVAPALALASPPNFIFILADDMGYGDLGAYGNAGVSTPHLDRLANEGIQFDQFYATAPLCSPSRAAFLTGQYPQRWKITSFLSNREANARRGMANALSAEAPTLPRQLQASGYATGHFGKWHLGGQRDVGDAPLIAEYGFDESLTQFEGLGDRILPEFSRPMEPNWKDNRHPLGIASARLGQGEARFVPRASATSLWVQRAITFIDQAQAAGRPFYVNLWPDDPHTPVEPSAPLRGDYSPRSRYLGVLHELDRDLGVLIDHIRHHPQLRENTIIIFASDNGPEEHYGSAGGLRGHKGELYEGGIRGPLIIWAPGLMRPEAQGRRDQTTVLGGQDLAPSLLTIAGTAHASTQPTDGIDMSHAFLGQKSLMRPTPLFWSRPPGRFGDEPDLAVRDGRWKLLCDQDGGSRQLYDLASDPGETINQALNHPEETERLTASVLAWRRQFP